MYLSLRIRYSSSREGSRERIRCPSDYHHTHEFPIAQLYECVYARSHIREIQYWENISIYDIPWSCRIKYTSLWKGLRTWCCFFKIERMIGYFNEFLLQDTQWFSCIIFIFGENGNWSCKRLYPLCSYANEIKSQSFLAENQLNETGEEVWSRRKYWIRNLLRQKI